jgi:hypothetical protein
MRAKMKLILTGRKKMKPELFTDLNDDQAEKVIGGVGQGSSPGSSAGFFGWGTSPNQSAGANGLFRAGFTPGDFNPNSAVTVVVPGPRDA